MKLDELTSDQLSYWLYQQTAKQKIWEKKHNPTSRKGTEWAWFALQRTTQGHVILLSYSSSYLCKSICWNCLCVGGEVLSIRHPAGLIQSPMFLWLYLGITWMRAPGDWTWPLLLTISARQEVYIRLAFNLNGCQCKNLLLPVTCSEHTYTVHII